MAFTVLDVPQRSPEWKQARLGRLTATCAADLLAAIKGSGEPAARRNLRVRLVLERLTGRPIEREYQSQAMLDGILREADALRRYEALTGQLVRRSGFLVHDSLQAGASLDGHLGNFDTVVEIKAPIEATHLEYIRSGIVPQEYRSQLLHQLWITGAARAHFVSFQPHFPERLRLLVVDVPRDEGAISAYDRVVRSFLREVDVEHAALLTMAAPSFRAFVSQVA